jgi:uncharacterized protein
VAASRPVVSNTTPLINLIGIGQADLLPSLYGEVTIPSEVRDEYTAGKAPANPNLEAFSWLQIVPGVRVSAALPVQLGSEEAAALSLAQTLNARAVLLDEAFGRRLARQMGLPIVGTLGILLAAKQVGLLTAVKPMMDAMIQQGRRISPKLRATVLRAAGE